MDARVRRRTKPGALERRRAGWQALRAGRHSDAFSLLSDDPALPSSLAASVHAAQAGPILALLEASGETPVWVSPQATPSDRPCGCSSPPRCDCESESGWWLLEDWVATEQAGPVRCLELQGPLSDAGWNAVASLSTLERVRQPGIGDCPESLAALGRLPALRQAVIHALEWPGVRAQLAALSGLPRLESLRLSCRFDRRSLGVFECLARSPSLRELKLHTGPWTDEDCLDALADLETLERLDMPYAPRVRGHGLERFAERGSGLRRLRLGGRPVAETLLFASDLVRLEELDLGNSRCLTNMSLAYLGGASRLRELRLWGAQRLNDGAIPWFGCLPALRDLSLGMPGLTARGVAELQPLGLEKLEIGGAPLGDDALQALRGWSALFELQLRGTRVSDRGLRALESLPSLRRVYVESRGGVTESGVERLRAALPEACVHVSGPGVPRVIID